MEAVHVLFRQNERKRPVAVQMARQGQLDQYAVDGRVRIGLANRCFQRFLGGIGRHAQRARANAQTRAGLFLVADIGLAGGIIAHQNDRKTGRIALLRQRLHALFQFFLQFGSHHLAVQKLC